MKLDKNTLRYFIFTLFVYGWLSANIPMPILPELTHVFDAPSSLTKFTVTIFLFGFAITQLVWGPLSDRHGRRKMLQWGFTITVIGALGAAFSQNIWMLIGFRFFEAIGMGCGPVLARSIIMDVYTSNKEKTSIIATSAIIVGIMPCLAPVIGGWLSYALTWHSVFLFLALYGCILLIATQFFMHETNLTLDTALTFKKGFKSYITCLKNQQFRGCLMMYGLYYGIQLGYYTAAPFIFIVHLHYSKKHYGWLMLFTTLAYILGAYLAKKLANCISLQKVIVMSIAVGAIGLALLIILNISIGMSALSAILPFTIVIVGSGMISPAVNTLGMEVFSRNKGSASALLGCSMSGAAALFSASMVLFSNENLYPLTSMLLFAIVASIFVYFLVLKPGIRTQQLKEAN